MSKRNRTILIALFTVAVIAAAAFLLIGDVHVAEAIEIAKKTDADKLQTRAGMDAAAAAAGLPTAQGGVLGIVSNVINAVLGLVGVIFLIMTIYSGFLWMTAQGNAEQVKKAKTILIQAAVGLVIITSAYGITFFILENLAATGTAATLTT